MAEDRAMEQLTMRVHADTLAHFKRWAADQPPVEGKRVPWSVEARRVLSRGFECELGRCSHAVRARERGERNAELLARVEELEARASSAPVAVDVDPLAPPEPVPLIEVLDPRGWVPVAWRGLDDRALAGKGCCLEHRQMREACDAASLHDEGV